MSTKTYLQAVNEVLTELSEVNLTEGNFGNAVNIQKYVKDKFYQSDLQLNDVAYKWPWLAAGVSSEPELGNTSVATTAGYRWYLLDSTATSLDEDFMYVDWDTFSLTTNGVSGESAPYTHHRLDFIDLDDWYRFYKHTEDRDASGTSPVYGLPKRVIRNPDGRRFGLSPIPKQEYNIYFYAWNRPTGVNGANDTFDMPEQYLHVLINLVRWYSWQFKENVQQASLAKSDYQSSVQALRKVMTAPQTLKALDDRISNAM